jgi:enoyl-CoA hydratase/carnithine racemase
MGYASVAVSVDGLVGHLELNRPQKGNAIDQQMWLELPVALQDLLDRGARAVSAAAENRLCRRLLA